MKTLYGISIGFLLGVSLSTLVCIYLFHTKQHNSKPIGYTILDVTELPKDLNEADKAKLTQREGSSGQIISHTSMAGFDLYEVDNRLVIVKDRYIRGLFNDWKYGIFPISDQVLLGEGPFIYYREYKSNSHNEIDDFVIGSLEYSKGNGSRIFEDYWLDGIDFIRKRYAEPTRKPSILYSSAYRLNSYLEKVTLNGYKCVAVPIAAEVPQDYMACCQSNLTGKVDLFFSSTPKTKLAPTLRPMTEEDVAEREEWWTGEAHYAETRQACLDNFDSIKHKSWHTFEPYKPQ